MNDSIKAYIFKKSTREITCVITGTKNCVLAGLIDFLNDEDKAVSFEKKGLSRTEDTIDVLAVF